MAEDRVISGKKDADFIEAKLVSIIIPVYQAKDTLKSCVLSCLNQKEVMRGELEIILVDDGSTDGSGEICDELQREYSKEIIKVVHTSNSGVSHARNIGMERASARFTAFVDSDDSVSDMFLENMLKYADEETSLIDETPKRHGKQKLSGYQYIESNILCEDTHVWGKLFNTEELKKNGVHFKEGLTIGEDLLFLIDFALAQGRKHTIKCVADGDYKYSDNDNGAMKTAFKESYIDQITCWRLAEDKLIGAKDNLSAYAYVSLAVSQVMTALLVVGKVAVLDEGTRDNDLCDLAVSEAEKQIEHALKTQGTFAALSFGYKIKTALFRFNQALYLDMYGKHKRK